jgi:xanthine/uracil permease
MSWFRATLVGVAVVAAAFVLLVEIPDLVLSQLSGVARGTRVLIATAWFAAALVALLWGLRRLQARWLRA